MGGFLTRVRKNFRLSLPVSSKLFPPYKNFLEHLVFLQRPHPSAPDDRKVLKLSPVVKRIAELVRESFSHSFSERMSLSCLISRFSIWRRFELFVFADYMRCCGVENKPFAVALMAEEDTRSSVSGFTRVDWTRTQLGALCAEMQWLRRFNPHQVSQL